MSGLPSKKEFDDWLTPRKAIQILDAVYGSGSFSYASKHTLIERLKGDQVDAIAGRTTWNAGEEKEMVRIHPDEWHHLDTSDLFWTTGDFTYENRDRWTQDRLFVRHYNVRFDPDEVYDIIGGRKEASVTVGEQSKPASSPPQAPPGTAKVNKGGRPPKEWWDDFWVEICRQIYTGELVPKRQVDLENAMHEWVTREGHDASERTIRNVARKLFEALNAEGKN